MSNRRKDNSYLHHGGELLVSDPYDVNEYITGRGINNPANRRDIIRFAEGMQAESYFLDL